MNQSEHLRYHLEVSSSDCGVSGCSTAMGMALHFRAEVEGTDGPYGDGPAVIDYFGTGNDGTHPFLSNFYWHDGWTVEHHYQAAKTDDPSWVARILTADTPRDAKRLGRKAPVRSGWDDERIPVMRTLERMKFRRPDMRQRLLGTGVAILIEGNWWSDTYWGVCKGEGENHLGRLLMQVREGLVAAGVDP